VKLCSQLAQTGNLMPRPQPGVRLSMDHAADAGSKTGSPGTRTTAEDVMRI